MTKVVFRRLERSDFAQLSTWLAAPHVARWWAHDPSPAALERDFGAVIDGTQPGEDDIASIVADGVVDDIGLVQFCMFGDYPEYEVELRTAVEVPSGAATIDYFIGDAHRTGAGLGRIVIDAFVGRVWASHPQVNTIIVPVHVDNAPSWRMLQAIGFTVVTSAELEPDNPTDSRHHLILRRDRPSAASQADGTTKVGR